MSYVTHITVPVSFEAASDEEALDMLTRLRDMLAGLSVGDAEIIDYPDATLQEVLPYQAPRSIEARITDVSEYTDE